MSMDLPHKDSLWYPLVRQIIIAGFGFSWAAFAYHNGIDRTDIYGGIGLMALVFGVDLTKLIAAPPAPTSDKKD